MDFETWEPVYEAILADFGYDRGADERARDVAAELASPFERTRFPAFEGATVAIAGAGPSLSAEREEARRADVVVAASTAADDLLGAGIGVDLLVTDLDKNPETARRLTRGGIPVVAHAHGDNVAAVREWLPTFEPTWTLATTQAAPREPVANFGGFTDGDRGAFLADEFGAGSLRFVGWDFEDPSVGPEKARKLRWAERLLAWLERRRDERFGVLEGRRDGLALPPGAEVG